MLGYRIPQRFDDMPGLSPLDDIATEHTVSKQIDELAQAHAALAARIELMLDDNRQRDVQTTRVLSAQMATHERAAWALRALIA